jgi:hypothetical protein
MRGSEELPDGIVCKCDGASGSIGGGALVFDGDETAAEILEVIPVKDVVFAGWDTAVQVKGDCLEQQFCVDSSTDRPRCSGIAIDL